MQKYMKSASQTHEKRENPFIHAHGVEFYTHHGFHDYDALGKLPDAFV